MDRAVAGAVPHVRDAAGRQVIVTDAVNRDDEERRQNRRTALILGSIVLVFFLGVIARRWLVGG